VEFSGRSGNLRPPAAEWNSAAGGAKFCSGKLFESKSGVKYRDNRSYYLPFAPSVTRVCAAPAPLFPFTAAVAMRPAELRPGRSAAPERGEGAKELRSPRRETPKVAPGAAEEPEGFRGLRSKTNGKATRSRKGLRSPEGDKREAEGGACRLPKERNKTRRGPWL